MAHSLDRFVTSVQTADTHKRVHCHEELVAYLSDTSNSMHCDDMDRLVDGLVSWISSSNYKISLNGLEVVSLLIDRMREGFKFHIPSVLPSTVDRLGDAKDQVRDAAQEVLLKLMVPASSPQFVFDRIMGAFTHKLWRVKEETCIVLQKTLAQFGARTLTISKLVPAICKLLDDQSIPVREAAVNTLVEIYRHVGERVRQDLGKKDINPSKLQIIFNKMDEVRHSGSMLASDASKDETDFTKPIGVPKTSARRLGSGTSSSTTARKTTSATKAGGTVGHHITPKITTTSAGSTKRKRVSSASSGGGAGAVDEESFTRQFEDVPKCHIFTSREVVDIMNRIRDMLSDPNHPWEKRCESLKECRSLLVAGAANHDEFFQLLRTLEPCIQTSAKDLRSQVVREACITISYYSQELGTKFDHFAEAVFPILINLIPNSAKIMATSGLVSIHFILQNTHAPRLIPILTSNINSKSSVIRRQSCYFLDQLLHIWPTHALERHIAVIQEAIKKGISDADSEARVHSRKAFWGFSEHFKDQADSLLNSLDPAKQKALQGEISNSSSNNSLNTQGAGRVPISNLSSKPKQPRSRSMSTERSNSTLYNRPTTTTQARRAAVAKASSSATDHTDGSSNGHGIVRSSSAVDLAAGGTGTLPKSSKGAGRVPQSSNYNSLRFRNMREMKQFQQRRRSQSSVEDVRRVQGSKVATPGPEFKPGSIFNTSKATGMSCPNVVGLSRSFDEHTLRASGIARPGTTCSTLDLHSARTRTAPSGMSSTHHKSSSSNTSRPKKSSTSSMGGSSSSTGKGVLSPERSRPRGRMGVSQSQPSSRSGSPSSRLAYITHTTQQANTTQKAVRKSAIPRSQGASREASPSRMYGRERKMSGQGIRQSAAGRQKPQVAMAQRVLTPGQDMEAALADALQRKRYESYESDDAASETSSICSERSFSSYSRTSEASDFGERRSSLRLAKDMADIVQNLSSGSWADRKEGLIALQNLLRGNRMLNRAELKKVTEIFTRMFHDPHGKVFTVFLETLIDLLAVHRSDLHDWLYVCLTRLLNKTGSDMLGSMQAKVQRALDTVRESFGYDHQFSILTRFIVDQTQTPNLKVKVSLLTYIHGLAMLMDPQDFSNSSDTRLAVSRVITWTTEPKSVDVRKAAQAVLIALFNLNPPEFSMMLAVLPKTFQDGASKILHTHLRSSSQEAEPLSPRNVTSPTTGNMHRYRPSPNRANIDDVGTENMNPEEIYNSIKQTSADIQNLSKLDSQFDDIKKEKDSTSQDSGIQGSMHDVRGTSPDDRRRQQYNPSYYQDDNLNGYNNSALAEAIFDVENELFNEGPLKSLLGIPLKDEFSADQSDMIADILTELSNHNRREEERKNAMLQLIKVTREGSQDVWLEHFKTILLLLLETLGDNNGHIRALSLRVLREILKFQPNRFKDYAELTILKILEAHKDPIREVSRAAEECATTVASSIPPEQCIRILVPIVQTAEFPVNLAAIKMETKIIEGLERDALLKLMPDVMPGLLKGYDNKESSVRKASVFSLVALHLTLGDDLTPFLAELTGSKMKLLNLYIKRAKQQNDCSASTSKTTSPTTDMM